MDQYCAACEKMDQVERHTTQKLADLAVENERLRTALGALLENVINLAAQTGQAPPPPVERNIKAARAALAKAEGGE